VLFKPGKNCDGYFTNENILEQTQLAMEIVKKYYPGDNHVFIFDNVTTHLKRPCMKNDQEPIDNLWCQNYGY